MSTSQSLLNKYQDDLNGLVRKFEQSGLGEKVNSWIGTGDNEQISASEIKRALGSELNDLAGKVGLGQDEAADELAKTLPEAVDKATPTGSVAGAPPSSST